MLPSSGGARVRAFGLAHGIGLLQVGHVFGFIMPKSKHVSGIKPLTLCVTSSGWARVGLRYTLKDPKS